MAKEVPYSVSFHLAAKANFSILTLYSYVFITKTESGGQFWRVLYNRCLIALFLSNVIIAILTLAKGQDLMMLYSMIPLPVLLIGFKFYCHKQFDYQSKYYSKGDGKKNPESGLPDKEGRRGDRVGVRFGHPALYRPLLTPMVHAKSQHMLKEVYRGRLDDDIDAATIAGYSDTYSMGKMSSTQPGKSATGGPAPFEIVPEGKLDFENFKNRADFADEHGGGGVLFDRPGTPSTMATGIRDPDRGRSSSRDSNRSADEAGTNYPAGYHQTPTTGFRGESPASSLRNISAAGPVSDERGLISSAAPMPMGTPVIPDQEVRGDTSYDYFRGKR